MRQEFEGNLDLGYDPQQMTFGGGGEGRFINCKHERFRPVIILDAGTLLHIVRFHDRNGTFARIWSFRQQGSCTRVVTGYKSSGQQIVFITSTNLRLMNAGLPHTTQAWLKDPIMMNQHNAWRKFLNC